MLRVERARAHQSIHPSIHRRRRRRRRRRRQSATSEGEGNTTDRRDENAMSAMREAAKATWSAMTRVRPRPNRT